MQKQPNFILLCVSNSWNSSKCRQSILQCLFTTACTEFSSGGYSGMQAYKGLFYCKNDFLELTLIYLEWNVDLTGSYRPDVSNTIG